MIALLSSVLALLLVGCSGLAITDEESGATTAGKVAARVLLAIPTFGMSEVHRGFEAQRRERETEQARYAAWVQTLSPAQREREGDRQARLDAARIQAWGRYLQTRPFQPAPISGYQPPIQCQTFGTEGYAQTTCR